MKKFVVPCIAILAVLAGISKVHAQGDIVTVKPQHDVSDPCAFIVTVSNHNSEAKNIDEIKLEITTLNGTIYSGFTGPTHWTGSITGSDLIADATSDNGGITPGASLGGFVFSYFNDGTAEYNNPVSITWTTINSGSTLSTGTIAPICTPFQNYTTNDTATVIPTQSGCDPCFIFTLIDRNSQNGASLQIWHAAFQLQNVAGGTMRPSKISAPQDWVLDSVTALTAYFHTDVNPLDQQVNPAVGGFKVCLRGSPNVTKFNFVWMASNDQNTLIDRDTIFNISNTATCSTIEGDSVSMKAATGCLYNVTLKNYHVSNPFPPSRIVKLILTSKTAGIIFASAPSAPPNWTKTVTSGSIIYAAKTDNDAIPSGIVSTNQFSFSVTGPTTTNFDIGWETDRAATPTLVNSGTSTQKCTVAAPATDSAFIAAGIGECNFDLTVKNAHNIKPQSNVNAVTITIPSGTGQLAPTSNTGGWNSSNVSPTQIKFQTPSSSEALITDNSIHLDFLFTPKTPGANVTATWATFDEAGVSLYSGDFPISCAPIITTCDTFMLVKNLNSDSCVKSFTLQNRKSADIVSMAVSVTNGWKIDTASTPSGWTKQIDGSHTSVTYTNSTGLKSGDSQAGFDMKFYAYFRPDQLRDTFIVIAITTDRNGITCTSVDSVLRPTCLAHIIDTTLGVAVKSGDLGVTNFMIQPNPTRGSADISFEMNTSERVIITVIDVLGHQIAVVSSKIMPQGKYHVPYMMNGLPDGTYYIRLQTPAGVITKKLILTK
jgi:hypothetical protein